MNFDPDFVAKSDHESRRFNSFFEHFYKKGPYARLIHRCLDASNKHGRLPVFAQDVEYADDNEKKKTNIGDKTFCTGSYEEFWERYRTMSPFDRRYYEIVLHDMPCCLYVDVDMIFVMNPTVNASQLSDRLNAEIQEMLKGPQFGLEIEIVLLLDSSNASKFSRHFIFRLRDVMFANNYHCGAFMRHLRNELMRKYGIKPEENPFFVQKKKVDLLNRSRKIVVWDFIADLRVYTNRRNWRLYFSSKGGEAAQRPLKLMNETMHEPKRESFLECLVQYHEKPLDKLKIVECLEEDGSVPISTNSETYLRPDLPEELAARKPGVAKKHDAKPEAERDPDRERFYREDYPFDEIFRLYGEPGREFAFTVDSGKYWRYLFFATKEEFERETKRVCPRTVEIGPVYADTATREVAKRELIFDVDLNDYTSFRACCGAEKKACEKCWAFAQFGICVLSEFLRDYGFNDVRFFFSGMKGFHCWCFDPAVAELSKCARETIAADLHLAILDDDNDNNLVKPPLLRSYVKRALDSKPRDYFVHFLEETQNLKAEFAAKREKLGLDNAILYYMWPRIDAQVTIHTNHLLKTPFSRHPRSKRMAVELKADGSDNPFLTK